MKLHSCLLVTFATFVLASATASAQQGIRVIDRGYDGEERRYKIVCRDGKRTTVINRTDVKEICANVLSRGELVCNKGWSVDDAAAAACKKQ